jgi:hypothetical protein
MQTNHLVTAARRSLLFLMVALLFDRGGKIVFVHADPDYKVRMKGVEVLAAAKAAATTSDALQK